MMKFMQLNPETGKVTFSIDGVEVETTGRVLFVHTERGAFLLAKAPIFGHNTMLNPSAGDNPYKKPNAMNTVQAVCYDAGGKNIYGSQENPRTVCHMTINYFTFDDGTLLNLANTGEIEFQKAA